MIQFYKNGKPLGVAFNDINDGIYYPAISLYRNAKVLFHTDFAFCKKNFEQNFDFWRKFWFLKKITIFD